MHNFEDKNLRDEDFELEFSDLPPDDEVRSISGKLVDQSSWLWTKVRGIVYMLFAASSLLLSNVRTWLLTDISSNSLARRVVSEDFELEITDLPTDGKRSVASTLIIRGTQLIPGVRLWRLVLVGCTLLLVFSFILSSFPPLQNKVYGLFVQSTSAPAQPTFISSDHVIIQGQNGSWQAGFTPVAAVGDSNIAPGPAPQGLTCPGRPIIDWVHEVGYEPVWVTDFSGPYATMHLFLTDVPVAAFSNGFGWTASLLVEISVNYRGPVTLSGSSLNGNSPLLFSFNDDDQEQVFSITLNTQQPGEAPYHINADTQRNMWNIIMYVPAAGCYTLHASWPNGEWRVNFAAGR
ncbi:MAG: hypothetical protein NVS4B7_13930 [Ktedonobacteraceae bacterium]